MANKSMASDPKIQDESAYPLCFKGKICFYFDHIKFLWRHYINNIHSSSKSNEWETPIETFEALNREFYFTLDPCATESNAKCYMFYDIQTDGLQQDWSRHRVFMNPPYGRQIGFWVKKAYDESARGALVVCLIPSRTDTKWWHKYCMKGEIRFIQGRLKFGDSKNNAPFPSAIVIFRPCMGR